MSDILVRFGADVEPLRRGTQRANNSLDRMRKQANVAAKAMAGIAVAATAAGAALVTKLTKDGLAAVDSQAKLARSLQGTNDSIRALQIVASDSGVDGLEKSLTRLNRRLGAVEMNGGPAAASIERLGLDVKALQEMDADERLAAIADAIHDTGMTSQESARHLQQLGFEQAEANDLFRQGGDAIRAARQEVQDYGLSLSEVDSAQVEAANDAFSRIGRIIEVIRQRLAVQLAPFIEHIANLMNDAAKEAGGFANQIDDGISKAIMMVAEVADKMVMVRRAFELGGHAAATGFAVARRAAIGLADVIVNFPTNAANMLIDVLNQITGINIVPRELTELGDSLREQFDLATRIVDEGNAAMVEIMERDLPSSGMEERLDEIRRKSREAAEQVVADRERMAAPTAGEIDEEEQASEEDERHLDQLEKRLERMRESMMNERELLEEKFSQRLEQLQEFREAELVTEQEFDQMAEQIEREHQDKMTALEEQGAESRKRIAEAEAAAKKQTLNSLFGDLSTLMNTESRKLFEVGKAAATANAIIDTHAGMAKALSQGGFAGIAMAAAVAAKGFASVSAIRSQSFGGSGAGAQATGSNTAAVNAASQPVNAGGGDAGPQSIVHLHGETFGQKQVRDLLESLNENSRDGGKVLVI